MNEIIRLIHVDTEEEEDPLKWCDECHVFHTDDIPKGVCSKLDRKRKRIKLKKSHKLLKTS